MADPWFEPAWQFGAYYGGGMGALLGVAGGVLGGCSYFVQQGRGRRWILGAYVLLLLFGCVSLLVGGYAMLTRQPEAIWRPIITHGGICVFVFGGLLPIIRRQYDKAEQRKIDAEGLRQS